MEIVVMLVAVTVLCGGLIAVIAAPTLRARLSRRTPNAVPRPTRAARPPVAASGASGVDAAEDVTWVAEPAWVAGQDDLEIEAAFARVERENAHGVSALVATRLDPLVRRHVPVRAVRAAPGGNSARICFADGTVVLARGRRPGGIAELAMHVHRQSVCVESWSREADVTTMHLRWAPRGSVAVVAVGLDQAD